MLNLVRFDRNLDLGRDGHNLVRVGRSGVSWSGSLGRLRTSIHFQFVLMPSLVDKKLSTMVSGEDGESNDQFWSNLQTKVAEEYAKGKPVVKLTDDEEEIIEQCLVMGKFFICSTFVSWDWICV